MFQNSAYEDNSEVFNNPNYTDKAEERRKFVGSDVPGQKQEAPASVHRSDIVMCLIIICL